MFPRLTIAVVVLAIVACRRGPEEEPVAKAAETPKAKAETKVATFGGGCFWCGDAIFRRVEGVLDVATGYAGGSVPNPTYKQVCTGTTGHAEVIQVTYDPAKVTYEGLLEVFFKTHDPTTLNRQGADEGTQYRSVILWHDEEQRRVAEDVRKRLDEAKVWDAPIVTEIAPFTAFYKAEDYHQDYFAENPTAGYCRAVIAPKVEKFEKVFKDRLKKK